MSNRSLSLQSSFTQYHQDVQSEIDMFKKLNISNQDGSSIGGALLLLNCRSSSSSEIKLFAKRKGSFELNASSRGNNHDLKGTWVGKSSINNNCQLLQHEAFYEHHPNEYQIDPTSKELSEKSCPIPRNNPLQQQQTKIRPKQKHDFQHRKNLLRNLSTFLNNFLLNSKRAKGIQYNFFQKYVRIHQPNLPAESVPFQIAQLIKQFHDWIRKQTLTNFEQYRNVWMSSGPFAIIYKQLSLKYYKEEAYCDIQHNTRWKKQVKIVAVKYLHQFIKGLQHPQLFNGYKETNS